MTDLTPLDQTIQSLANAVENAEPMASKRIKQLLDNPNLSFNQMRYLEGLLLVLGESPGELEDAPDIDNDPEEYWEEY